MVISHTPRNHSLHHHSRIRVLLIDFFSITFPPLLN